MLLLLHSILFINGCQQSKDDIFDDENLEKA